jgi:hypothetical protein
VTSPTKSWPHQSSTPKTPRPLVSSASSWAIYQHVGTGSANLRLQIIVASANTHTHLQHKRIVLKPTDSEKKKHINWFILDLPKSDQEAWLRSVFSFPPKQPLGAWRRTQLPICGDHGRGSAGLSIVLLAWRTWHLIGSQNVANNSPWHLSEPTSSATARSWPLPNTSTTHILAASKEKTHWRVLVSRDHYADFGFLGGTRVHNARTTSESYVTLSKIIYQRQLAGRKVMCKGRFVMVLTHQHNSDRIG